MNKNPTIFASRTESGKIKTIVACKGDDVLKLLATLNCSVMLIMQEAGNDSEAIKEVLHLAVTMGTEMAADKKGAGGAQ